MRAEHACAFDHARSGPRLSASDLTTICGEREHASRARLHHLQHWVPHSEPRAAEARHEAWLAAWKRPKLCVLGGSRVLGSPAVSCDAAMGYEAEEVARGGRERLLSDGLGPRPVSIAYLQLNHGVLTLGSCT